mmetsp:Transcript_2139/g.8345  ORF Transcript_2139/g.8345 Transcript_2139/m.8345 type:complete len:119 (-) Transcript_2139:1771-2127(-)
MEVEAHTDIGSLPLGSLTPPFGRWLQSCNKYGSGSPGRPVWDINVLAAGLRAKPGSRVAPKSKHRATGDGVDADSAAADLAIGVAPTPASVVGGEDGEEGEAADAVATRNGTERTSRM